jgi:acetolactate synthase-1/2/3 large subunit
MMAGTIGRLSGKPGIAVSIKGPGLVNQVPGLAFNLLEAYPMLAIAEAYTPSIPLAKAHKRLDHRAVASGVTKAHRFWSENGPDARALAAYATTESPGPVLLDIADAPVADDAPLPVVQGLPENFALLDRVARAERPLVIAGTLAIRAGWSQALARLAIPVFTTAAAKGLIDETLPHAGGVYTGVGLELSPEHALLPECDLVVGLGLRTNEVLAASLKVPAVNLDPLGSQVSWGFDFEASGPGDFDALYKVLASRSWGQDRIATARARLETRLGEGGFLPASAFRAVQQRFGRECRIVLDTGYFCTIGEHACYSPRVDLFLGSGQARDMGAGVPMALAAALYDPSVPTVLAIGDGGIGMYAGELCLAVEHNLPLLVLFMTDGGFGSIRPRAQKLGLTQEPLIMKDPKWMKVFQGMGFSVQRVNGLEGMEAALANWTGGEPLFIEAAFDAGPYQAMVQGIRD